MIIRRTHWYVDARHRCKGVGSELKKNKKNIYYRTALSLNLWRHVYCDVIDAWHYTQSLQIGRWHSRGGMKSLKIGSLDM